MSTYLYRAFDCIFLSYHVRTSDITSVSGKEFLDILSNIEFGFTLKCVRDMTRTYSQIKRTDKYSQHSSIIGQFGQLVECSFTNYMVVGSSPFEILFHNLES